MTLRFGTDARASARTLIIAVAACLGACSNVETCEEPAFYENAVPGKRVEAPDGLDNLAAYKEVTVPEASPRPPRDRSEGCLDRPPTLRINREEDEAGEDEEGA